MNGDTEEVEIELNRAGKGLGFNIKGGCDIPHVDGDNGIFVTKVRETGAAADDGRLNEGDKILEINEHSLVNVRHEEAVNCFRNSSEIVKLKIIPGAEAKIRAKLLAEGSKDTTDNDKSPKSELPLVYIVAAVGVVAVLAFAGYRFLYRRA